MKHTTHGSNMKNSTDYFNFPVTDFALGPYCQL